MINLTIVCPCYNEELILQSSADKLKDTLNTLQSKGKISNDSCILFVNDGSTDTSWKIISKLHSDNRIFRGLDITCNVGHQYAILAGMMTAKEWSDAVITMDVDLQDDLNCIEQMVDAYNEGAEVVYGIKESSIVEPFMKRFTAQTYYKIQKSMGINIIYNHSDFRLLGKEALNTISEYKEKNIYLRGLIPSMGFPSAYVKEIISKREAGKSKYTLKKMVSLAMDGITSFSIKPLMFVIPFGFVSLLISIGILIYILVQLFSQNPISEWILVMDAMWFIGGILMIALGIIGCYIGKILIETKDRPRYIIREIL